MISIEGLKMIKENEKKGKTLVLGIGNPILTDDAAGILVVRELQGVDAEVKEAPVGGLSLLDYILGYSRVIVVDAVKTGAEPGKVFLLEEPEVERALHASSSHDMSFSEAVELGRKLYPEEMPSDIVVVGIEVQDTVTFSETPTEPVLKAVPVAVGVVKDLLTTRERPQRSSDPLDKV